MQFADADVSSIPSNYFGDEDGGIYFVVNGENVCEGGIDMKYFMVCYIIIIANDGLILAFIVNHHRTMNNGDNNTKDEISQIKNCLRKDTSTKKKLLSVFIIRFILSFNAIYFFLKLSQELF